MMTETMRPEPSRPFRWVVLISISLTMFGNYYVYDCIAPIADLLAKQLGFSDSNIGLLQAIYSIPNVVMVLIGGYVVDRIGTRKAILIFGTLCFFGAVVTSLSGALTVMASGRLIFGLGAESLIVAVTTAVAKWFRGKELSFAFGINLMISRAGTLLAQQ
ncbi:MAG TPA: MFS transporter, partial [Candidatus Acidoferrum sp.]|nr:MFS transporter [Candidatus Acidoferrum sp.]